VEDIWEPDQPELDELKVTRKIPAISITLILPPAECGREVETGRERGAGRERRGRTSETSVTTEHMETDKS
jgi:hypothetical protein